MRAEFTRLRGEVGNVEGLIQIQRLGKIRLGVKKKSASTGNEFPSETEHFIVPPEVAAIYGEAPMQLDAMFPSDDENEIYQEKLALYGSTQGLKCHGDGTRAERKDEQTGDWVEVKCPCAHLKTHENPKGQCSPQAHLKVILPKVSMWGYYQITTRSMYARGGILGALDRMKKTLGKIAGIPIKLVRLPKDITPKGGKKKTHYILSFIPDLSIEQILNLRNSPDLLALPSYALTPAVDENPLCDPVDEVVEHEQEEDGIDAAALAEMEEKELDAVKARLDSKRQETSKQEPKQEATPEPKPQPPQNNGKPKKDPINNDADWQELERFLMKDPNRLAVLKKVLSGMQIEGMNELTKQGRKTFMERVKTTGAEMGVKIFG